MLINEYCVIAMQSVLYQGIQKLEKPMMCIYNVIIVACRVVILC